MTALAGLALAAALAWAGVGDAAPPGDSNAGDAIALPGWLAGCWMADGDAGAHTEECWTVPRGSMILGSSHSFAEGRTGWFEHMRIEQQDGSLTFVAQPRGAPPTRFPLQATMVGPDLRPGLLFVNAANDYPQRIVYWRDGEDLLAEISLIDGSRAQRWIFRRP